jgi:hypothetical protein
MSAESTSRGVFGFLGTIVLAIGVGALAGGLAQGGDTSNLVWLGNVLFVLGVILLIAASDKFGGGQA